MFAKGARAICPEQGQQLTRGEWYQRRAGMHVEAEAMCVVVYPKTHSGSNSDPGPDPPGECAPHRQFGF